MFLASQAELAIGSRLKALSECFYAAANAAYRAAGVALDAHWFPVLRFLQVKGPAGVGEIAAAIGQTHSAVSQMAVKLRRERWLVRKADRDDARKRLLELSPDGEARLAGLGPIWTAIRRGARACVERSDGPLVAALGKMEADFARGRVLDEILAEHARLCAATPIVRPFRPEWREHFYRINAEWLERWFTVEEVDRKMLCDPEGQVLGRGGAIFFALVDGEVIGTSALLRESPGVYELSKMAVSTGWRGLGAGRMLLEAAVAHFERRRGKTLFLESNRKLAPALALYESAGFVHQPGRRPGSHYERSNVYMIYDAARRVRIAPRRVSST